MSSIPYATPDLPPDLGFPDQRGGMKVLGIVLIVIGALAGCLAGFTPVALIAPRMPGVPAPLTRDIITGAGVYALFAALLITAGTGSLRVRRWSRPIILIITGTWAVGGVLGLISFLIVGADMQRAMATMAVTPPGPGGGPGAAPGGAAPAVPQGFAGAMMAVTVVILLVFGVLLPGGYFWFYARRSVRQTVEFFDPTRAWTDRCPTPVLALSAWLLLCAVFTLSFCFWGVFPLFGRLLTGAPAILTLLVISIVLACLAIGTYRLSQLAWWGTVVMLVLLVVSAVVTFSRVDPMEVHRLSGTPPETLRMMEQMGASSRTTTNVMNVLYGVAGLGYLIWVWRYFRQSPGQAELGSRAFASNG